MPIRPFTWSCRVEYTSSIRNPKEGDLHGPLLLFEFKLNREV